MRLGAEGSGFHPEAQAGGKLVHGWDSIYKLNIYIYIHIYIYMYIPYSV